MRHRRQATPDCANLERSWRRTAHRPNRRVCAPPSQRGRPATRSRGARTLGVVGVRDDDADQPPSLHRRRRGARRGVTDRHAGRYRVKLAGEAEFWHCPAVRRGVALVFGSLALAAPAGAHDVRFFWSVPKVMRATDDVRVRVGTTLVRIDEATTLCNGQGTSMRRKGIRVWRHFLCTYTTRRGLGRDVEFRVHVLGLRRFVITDTHWVGASR